MSIPAPLFADRTQAGQLLAEAVVARRFPDPIVYALPRGGAPVALEVARRLEAPLDLALVRKIGAPGNPELALAAVVDGDHPRTVVNDEIFRLTGADADYLERESALQLAEIERRRRLYLGDRPRPSPEGKTAIVVDDGLATGATARVAVQALRGLGAARVILAVPVAPSDTAALLRGEVDELICLAEPARFTGVGAYYVDFHQLTDADVLAALAESARFDVAAPPASGPDSIVFQRKQ